GVGMAEKQGAADVLMIPDPSTFRVLPWAPDTGWFLCELQFQDGSAVPYCTRQLLRKAIKTLGYEFIAGLEVEFHVFKILDPNLKPSDAGQPGTPPEVELLSTGYQYLTEQRYDLIDPVVQLLRKDLESLGLPLRSFEVGKAYLAGLLAHARASSALSTPTINGYKGYRPYSLAPDRVVWGKENRGAMLRVVGGPGDPGTRIENRIGEPAANPYLYFASQIYSGLDGIDRKLALPPCADTPYEAKADLLPRTLSEALVALK